MLEATLEYGGFGADVATSALDALQRLSDRAYDAVLLDLGLPDLDGSHLIKTLRSNSDVPIMVVSGRGTEQDKITSLDLGADDFIAKPFLPGELLARIRAVLRRRGAGVMVPANDINGGNGALQAPEPPGRDVPFARLEGRLFTLLEARGDDVVTYDEIIDAIWGQGKPRGQSHVRVLIGQLRRKLEMQNSPYKIRSERGAGYRLWKAPDA